jgi:hypothetical protein
MSDDHKLTGTYARIMEDLERDDARRKAEWIDMYRLYAGQKWTDPAISYEQAARAWDERHGSPG